MRFDNNESVFGPRKITISDVGILSVGSLIAGLVGSIVLLFFVFITSGFIDIPGSFSASQLAFGGNSTIFPFLLSFITFFVTVIVSFSTYFFSTFIDPLKFKRTLIHFGQVAFFSILVYIFMTPIYIYVGMMYYNEIMIVFIAHVLILSFGIGILLEILNNYRYILLGVYASFMGLFLTSVVIFLIFFSFETGFAKLVSLLVILPLSNGLLTFFKGLFELLYYFYFKFTGLDQLGDIFHQIEQEEEEELNNAIEENTIFNKVKN